MIARNSKVRCKSRVYSPGAPHRYSAPAGTEGIVRRLDAHVKCGRRVGTIAIVDFGSCVAQVNVHALELVGAGR